MKLFMKIGTCLFLTIAVVSVSCSNEDTSEKHSSNVDNAQVVTDLKNVNAELLSTVPHGTRRWSGKEMMAVVGADIGGAWRGGVRGSKIGGAIGMGLGSPITGGAFGAFLGGVIGGAFASWLVAPEMIHSEDSFESIKQACEILINDDMSINENAIEFAVPATISKLDVAEKLVTESKLDEYSLNIGKTHNIILSVMDGSVILQNEEPPLSNSSNLKEAFFNSEDFIEECKAIGEEASGSRLSNSDNLLNKVMGLFNQVLEGYASKTDDIAFIIGKYVDVIEKSNELTTEQKQCVKSGLATALYSFKYWESTFE